MTARGRPLGCGAPEISVGARVPCSIRAEVDGLKRGVLQTFTLCAVRHGLPNRRPNQDLLRFRTAGSGGSVVVLSFYWDSRLWGLRVSVVQALVSMALPVLRVRGYRLFL